MKKQELQKILKPLIKECIKEVIFEEGVLSNLIKEVAVGIGQQQVIVETRAQEPEHDFSNHRAALQEQQLQALEDKKKKLEESLGLGNIFENTSPLSGPGSPSSGGSSNSPLSTYAPGDPGVDISGIMAIAGGQNWKKMI